jgi:hypothetical protein
MARWRRLPVAVMLASHAIAVATWPLVRSAAILEGLSQQGSSEMCDFSLHHVKSRQAKVGYKLTTRDLRYTGVPSCHATEVEIDKRGQ